jgi:hypothetical protein
VAFQDDVSKYKNVKGEPPMATKDCMYSASSIFRNFIGHTDVKVNWFKLMKYNEDPNKVDRDAMFCENYWSELISDYGALNKWERWIARLYASEFFSEDDLPILKELVERYFVTTISVEGRPLPLVFRDSSILVEATPYLFISDLSDTIPLYYGAGGDKHYDFDYCGHVNVDGLRPAVMELLAQDYSRGL